MPDANTAVVETVGPLCVMPAMLSETIAQALETMAFMSPMPPAGLLPEPPVCRVMVAFTGQWTGCLEIIGPLHLGAIMAANQLGCTPADSDATQHAEDAFMELANVTCGLLLRKVIGTVPKLLNLLPPVCQQLESDTWPQLLANGGVSLDAENCPIIVRVHSHGQDQ